jgi:hypothetical protein
MIFSAALPFHRRSIPLCALLAGLVGSFPTETGVARLDATVSRGTVNSGLPSGFTGGPRAGRTWYGDTGDDDGISARAADCGGGPEGGRGRTGLFLATGPLGRGEFDTNTGKGAAAPSGIRVSSAVATVSGTGDDDGVIPTEVVLENGTDAIAGTDGGPAVGRGD